MRPKRAPARHLGHALSTIDEALRALHGGGVVVIPTDTVYGLACRPEISSAVEKIFTLKGRPADKTLQVLIPDAGWLDRLGRPTDQARLLARSFWPGPLTILVDSSDQAPAAVASEGVIGLRVPSHAVVLELLLHSGPLAATSANHTGEATPADVASIADLFGDDVDAYIDGGRIDGTASTVVDATVEPVIIRRRGAIPAGELERVSGSRFDAE